MRRVFPLRQAENSDYFHAEQLRRRPSDNSEEPVKKIDEHKHAHNTSEKLMKLLNSSDSSTVSGDENLNNINNSEVTLTRPPSCQKPPRASAYPIFTAGASHRNYISPHSVASARQKLSVENRRAASFSSDITFDSQSKLVKETPPSKQKDHCERPLSVPKNRPFPDTSSRQNSFRSRSLRLTQLPDSVTLVGGVDERLCPNVSDRRYIEESPPHARSSSQSTSEGSLSGSSDSSSCFTKATESSESSTSKKSSVSGSSGRGSSPFKYLSARMVAEKLVKVLGKEKVRPQLNRPTSCELLQDSNRENSYALAREQSVGPGKEKTKQDLSFKQSSLPSPGNTKKNASELLVIIPFDIDKKTGDNFGNGNEYNVEHVLENQHTLNARALAREELALSVDKESILWEGKHRSGSLENYAAEATVRDFNSLKHEVRKLRKEKKDLAFEVAREIRARISEQNVAADRLSRMKMEIEAKVSSIEKDKDDIQESLEKELERRGNEWNAKLDKMKAEERKLRERVKELAEEKNELQKVVTSHEEKEVCRRAETMKLESLLSTLKQRMKANETEMARQMEASAGTLEKMKVSNLELETFAQRNSYLEMENLEMQKEVTRLRRVCNDQEMTIEGLWQELDEAVNGTFECRSESLLRLQRELLRLAGVEQGLRSEINAIHAELTSLKQEKSAAHAGTPADLAKLNQELQDRVDKLQLKAVELQEENKQLSLSLRAAIRARRDAERILKLSQLKGSNQSGESMVSERSEGGARGNKETIEGGHLSRISFMEESLRVLNSKLQSREAELKRLDEEIIEILNSGESLQMEVDDLHGKLLAADQRIRELEREANRKEVAMEIFQTDAERHKKELTNLQNELSRLKRQRDEVQKDAEDMGKEALRLTLELNESRKAAEKLEEELMLKEGQISILRGTYANSDCLS